MLGADSGNSNFFLARSLGKTHRTFIREYKKPDIKRELPHIASGIFFGDGGWVAEVVLAEAMAVAMAVVSIWW